MDGQDFQDPKIESSEATEKSPSFSEFEENTESKGLEENTENNDPKEECSRDHLTLCQFIIHGDLQGVKDYLNHRPDTITAWIDVFETPLIKACMYGRLEIVKELLHRMCPEQMLSPVVVEETRTRPVVVEETRTRPVVVEETRTRPVVVEETRTRPNRISPLWTAALYGYFEIVVVLLEKNPNLVAHEYVRGDLPVIAASHRGFRKITRYLYDRTPFHVLMDDNGYGATCLLLNAVSYGMFGIIDLELPTDLQSTSFTPCQRIMWMFLQCLPKCFEIQRIYDQKERSRNAHDFLRGVCRQISAMVMDSELKNTVIHSVFTAVDNGNTDFFIEIVKCVPRLLRVSECFSHRNLFQIAVASRKENIFNLIYGLDVRRFAILQKYDKQGNNILHIAARLSPPDELSKVAGAAIKIQRELQWFKEVEALMLARDITKRNKDGLTPRELFEKSHEPLRKEGEEWMKYTATACSFVAALIATVTFQAIFTTPGGNNDTSGDPIHLQDFRFTLFIVSDTISFFTSCTSVLIFLSILTARYSFDDFWVSLPRKMILGLTILFVSIAAMLVAFSSALFMSLRQRPMLAIPVMPLACLPAILFLMMQYPLMKEMISSTYGKGLFDRDTKPWL